MRQIKKLNSFNSKGHIEPFTQEKTLEKTESEIFKLMNTILTKAIKTLPKKYQAELKRDEDMIEELFDTWWYTSDDSDMLNAKLKQWFDGELTDNQCIEQCVKNSNLKAAYDSFAA